MTSVSQRGRGAKYSLMDVRIELDAAAALEPCVHAFADGSIAQAADARLRLPAARRTTISRRFALSDLKGSIDADGCERNE